jgi:hypothetical protein
MNRLLLELRESQRQAESTRASELAKQLSHTPSGELMIRNVTLFDSATGKVLLNQRVTIHGERISSVEQDDGRPTPGGSQAIDGRGKMLFSGLWDMHTHLFREDAFLDIAAGVTTVRDRGNSIEELTNLASRFGTEHKLVPACCWPASSMALVRLMAR